MKPRYYIVIRSLFYLGYTEYLGPVCSTPNDIAKDAKRLWGKPDHHISWVALSKASPKMKELLNKGIV